MDELKKQAEELGIKVDGRWSEERLQAEIDKVLSGEPMTDGTEEHEEDPGAEVAEEAVEESVEEAVAKEDPSDEEETDELEEEMEEENSVTLANLSDNANKRLGLKARGSVVLTADQLADERLMARIMHGVETGVLALS